MSERRNDGLPADWEELGREDADALAPPPGAKERVQRHVATTLGLHEKLTASPEFEAGGVDTSFLDRWLLPEHAAGGGHG